MLSRLEERVFLFITIYGAPNCIAFLVWRSMIGPPPLSAWTIVMPALVLASAVYFAAVAALHRRRDYAHMAICQTLVAGAWAGFMMGFGATSLLFIGLCLGVDLALLVEARVHLAQSGRLPER